MKVPSPMRKPPALSGDAGCQDSTLHSRWSKIKEKPQWVGDKWEKSTDGNGEGDSSTRSGVELSFKDSILEIRRWKFNIFSRRIHAKRYSMSSKSSLSLEVSSFGSKSALTIPGGIGAI
ncbi:hypothetical protein Tco_1032916 [Tanacetum coccineum]|uniref:Uncharacterized protein n=1 Tax=Tanacetum coccineum TaxID=301880 RepID=A0ABQ5GDS7_9ASTR